MNTSYEVSIISMVVRSSDSGMKASCMKHSFVHCRHYCRSTLKIAFKKINRHAHLHCWYSHAVDVYTHLLWTHLEPSSHHQILQSTMSWLDQVVSC